MRAWSVLRQLLAATLCAVLALPACSSAAPLSSSTPSHIYDAETLSETRVWGSNEKILLHIRATLLVSEKQHWGYEKCRWENVVGSGVTYDFCRLRAPRSVYSDFFRDVDHILSHLAIIHRTSSLWTGRSPYKSS